MGEPGDASGSETGAVRRRLYLGRRGVTADLRLLPDPDHLARVVADAVAETLAAAALARGAASMALAGGNTPRALYRALATRHRHGVPWENLDLFWGDERDVPLDDARSNYRMAREALLDAVPVPPARVHPMPAGTGEPEAAAVAYERTLRAYFGAVEAPGAAGGDVAWPAFDLVLLGLGEDAHTASLFPGSAALEEEERWVVPALAPAPVEPRARITLTLPALTHARRIFVVVSGAAKAPALERALAQPPGPDRPASLLLTGPAPVTWWADTAAAGLLSP